MLAIRGAITVENNSKEDILKETTELLEKIIKENDLKHEEIISIIFTATKDLTKAYPAVAARALNIVNASLLCMQEMYVEGSLEQCVRVLLHINRKSEQCNMRHIYLKGAKVLRPDID